MLRIDLSKDQRSFLLISEDDHVVTIPAKASALELIKQLLAARQAGRPVGIGQDSTNPVQNDVDRYLARPFWDQEKSIEDWLARNTPLRATKRASESLSLEDLDL